jgi:hypothetical protein
MNFKPMPFVIFHEKDDDREEGNKEAHYTFEWKSIVIGPIEEPARDENDNYDTYSVNNDNIPDNDELLQELVKTKKDLSGVKTIHFDDTCKVPRFKLGEICGKQGIRVIRDRDKADAVIYGNNFTKSIFDNVSADAFNYKADFIAQAKKVKCKRNLITEIIPLVEACESDIILLDSYDGANGSSGCKLRVKKRIKTDDEPSFDLDYTVISDESKYVMITEKNNLIHQDVILENLSSIVMDEAMHKSVCSMFDSKDASNHLVGMEIMSNTAYRKSLVYLLDLMRKYWAGVIDKIHEKKNISFKAFREYIDYNPSYNERSFDELIDSVISKNALTESNYKLILKLMLEQEHESMKEDNNRWVITSLDLAPEQKAKVIWNKVEQLTLTEAL